MQTTKHTQVPALRFPEFEGDWKRVKLGTLGKFIGGGTPSTKNKNYWTGEIPWVSSSDLVEDKISTLNITRYITKEAITNSATKLIPANSLLLVSRVGVGKLAINTTPICTSQDFSNFIPNQCDVYFVGSYLLYHKAKLINFSQGTSIKGFTTSDIKNFRLVLPQQAEQQKIANFLSKIDQKISLLQEKKQQLQQFKKGMMQQLFSQQIRFLDENGEAFPAWEQKKLGEITTLITKGTTPKKFVSNGINYIKIECFNGTTINKQKCLHISEHIHTTVLSRSILQEQDILFAIAGSIGKTAIVTKDSLPANTNQALAIIRLKKEGDTAFIFHLLCSELMAKYIYQNKSTGAQPNLNLGQINNFTVSLPSLPEQKKIANFLSNLDQQIEHTKEQIEQTQVYKKGLLQQLLV